MTGLTKQFSLLATKYMLVGATSAIIDIGLLAVLVEYAHIPLMPAATLSFLVAVGNGFLLNKRWTFRDRSKRLARQYTKFFLTGLVGLALNVSLLALFVYGFNLWYLLAKIFVTGIVFFWNFTINRFWTFRDYTIPRPERTAPPTKEVSVVIPAYNEEREISPVVMSAVRYLRERWANAEIIVVDDGSTDTTAEQLRSLILTYPMVRAITHDQNRGKGASVRDGVHATRGALILFMDADGSTPIESFDAFVPYLGKTADIVIGSRYLKESSIIRKQPWCRVLLGRIGNLIIQLVLLENIKDTQCGFKAFTHESAHALFRKSAINRWGFDTEILTLAQYMGYTIKEIPIQWHDSVTRKSRLRPIKDAHRTLRDLICIKYNILAKRYH
ncbi:glycosyltransferase [Candidatus Uhrbacteria bacterium]|nr:glycosyltransferase [Candidatus Uhrbacteria bacterium]